MKPTEEQTQEIYRNTQRDDATTAKNQLKADEQPGLANEDTPEWRPPESDPEPRPPEPMMTDASSPQV